MTIDDSRGDLQGPTGNTYEKYSTANPVSRFLVDRFLAALDEMVGSGMPGSVLDVGCGEGIVTERLARRLGAGVPVEGLDVDDPVLHEEWASRGGGNLTFTTGSAYRHPHATDSVDMVVAVEVFEHLQEPGRALREAARVARDALVVTAPREPLWRLGNMLSGRYWRRLGNTPGHINHWSRSGLAEFTGRVGTVVELRSPVPWTLVRLDLRG
ncbi:MAG: class I SAM-dependent methyltransferase [Miltoncostaeaceae bacterium]